MNRRGFVFSALASVLAAQNAGSTLVVEVSYTGSGTVDASHKIIVALWDTAEFVKDGTSVAPIATKRIASKSGAATFQSVQKSPSYISMGYDPSGQWDGESGPPPSGTSLGLYSKQPGTPAPIELKPGKTTKIAGTFDDSFKAK
jgi:hypothetical protein